MGIDAQIRSSQMLALRAEGDMVGEIQHGKAQNGHGEKEDKMRAFGAAEGADALN